MIIDMSGTVTVIPDASGTITKLHIRIIHIGDPANFTLSGIRSIITVSVHLFRRFLVIDDFRIIVPAFLSKELEQLMKKRIAEFEEVHGPIDVREIRRKEE